LSFKCWTKLCLLMKEYCLTLHHSLAEHQGQCPKGKDDLWLPLLVRQPVVWCWVRTVHRQKLRQPPWTHHELDDSEMSRRTGGCWSCSSSGLKTCPEQHQ
jgi:hypothetical protein